MGRSEVKEATAMEFERKQNFSNKSAHQLIIKSRWKGEII